MLTLALIFGGRSAEHDVSLVSARCVAAALDPARYQVVPVGITREGRWLLPDDLAAACDDGLEAAPSQPVALLPDPSRPGLIVGEGERVIPFDVAFPVLHGPFGEDGTIQGLFEMAGVAYVGSGVAASGVGMDKELMKGLFAEAGLPQVGYLVARDRAGDVDGVVAEVEGDLDYPVFVKPVNLGSSVGIVKAHDRSELRAAVELGFSYDRKVIIEATAEGREVECAVLGNEQPEASVVGEVLPGNEFYDYEAKYTEGKMAFALPAPISDAQATEVRRVAVAAFKAVDACGLARCDFFIEQPSGRVLLNEINTIPGMTDMSAFPKLWEASGLPFRALTDRLVELALARHATRRGLRTTLG